MWKTIQSGGNITAIVKNLSKSGRYYWVMTDFENHRDSDGNIDSYIAFKRALDQKGGLVWRPGLGGKLITSLLIG